MTSRLHRRDFLRATVLSTTALGAFLPACGDDENTPNPSETPADQKKVYPQGVASGDPTPGSVILWTRVEPEKDEETTVSYEVATDEKFADIVADGSLTAEASADHTVRMKVDRLDPATRYYYRFTAKNVRSVVGRTKTAPAAGADVPVRFAFAACQDYIGRFYHAWKALTEEDAVDFVVYLGDYIYETDGDPSFQTPGHDRSVTLPDGIVLGTDAEGNPTSKAASSLEDYRTLYKTYRSDENLQKAHQLFPFVTIWDDHEFGNDCWGDHTTHFSDTKGTEEEPAQRKAADRAWSEYQPSGVVFDDNKDYPNDIKIYRALQFGKHVDLVLTDQRYYRDDHVIPEGPVNLDVAKIIADSAIGSRIFLLKKGFDKIEAEKKPTMLGATQKAWLLDQLKSSTATWKVWGNEVQLTQMLAQLARFTQLPETFRDTFYLTTDQWDGYRTERAEILGALEGIENLVAVTGDIHAFYASELHVDFDNPTDSPMGVEYVTAGITSQAIAPAAKSVLDNPTFAALGLGDLIPDFDDILKEGSPWYRYANSFSNGIAVVDVTAAKFAVTFLIIENDDVTSPDSPTIKRVKMQTLSGTNKVEVLA